MKWKQKGAWFCATVGWDLHVDCRVARSAEKRCVILYEYDVQIGPTPPPAMTTLAFSCSTIPSSQTPTLLPFFFFLCSARCYFCCLFRSHFPPVAARPSMHPFSNPSEHPVWRVYNPGQDSYFLSSDTNSSKKHVLREGIRLSTWIFFSPFFIHISASCF